MEISKLYETASEKLNEAKEKCSKSEIPFSSITIINTDTDNTYIGVNWKKLNDSFEEEKTCSEYEAICKMLLAGENSIASIVTLEPDSKIPNCPCSECQKLIIRLNPDKNRNAKILTGKNSQVVLTSLNNEIAEYAEQFKNQFTENIPADDTAGNENAANESAPETSAAPDTSVDAPEGSAASTSIDASGLKMIFDDWESSAEREDENKEENKPFNANSLSSSQQEVINTVQNMSQNTENFQQPAMNNMYQQPMNNMYQQPMSNMYQQPMNNMYQQPMNNMYQQQPMNNMYQQQPMNNMYQQQPMNNMYQQQPMNNMYQQPNNTGGRPTASLYLNQPNKAAQQASIYANNLPPRSSAYVNNMQAPIGSRSSTNTQSVSVYGTNINGNDNNAIFKDRLNDILGSKSNGSTNDDVAKEEVMQSAKDKKKAAKNDARFLKKMKKNEFN